MGKGITIMADNADSTGHKQLPTFSTLKPFEQLAVTLKAEGSKYEEIVNTINSEYSLAYKQISVRQWFMAGGRLEQAYLEYNEAMADQAVIEAKLKIKRLSNKAADTLDKLMDDDFDGRVRQQAARTVLGKYIPDRQVVIDESKADDLPSAIGDAGDEVLNDEPTGGDNGQNEVADTRESETPGPNPGE